MQHQAQRENHLLRMTYFHQLLVQRIQRMLQVLLRSEMLGGSHHSSSNNIERLTCRVKQPSLRSSHQVKLTKRHQRRDVSTQHNYCLMLKVLLTSHQSSLAHMSSPIHLLLLLAITHSIKPENKSLVTRTWTRRGRCSKSINKQ